MKQRATNLPAGHFDPMAAMAPAYISPEQANRPWSKRYAAPNILHFFSQPSRPPDGRERRALEAPEPESVEPVQLEPQEPTGQRPWMLSEADKESIRAQVRHGKTFAALAAEFKVSRQAVWSIVNGATVRTDGASGKPTAQHAANRREEIRRRWMDGENQADLAKAFHMSVRTLRRIALGGNGGDESQAGGAA